MKQNQVSKMVEYKIPLRRIESVNTLKEKIRTAINKQEKLGCKLLKMEHAGSYIALMFKKN